MKKNVMLKIAAVLLVAVLLSTCAISATFAKYVANGGEKTASARVAKWGVEATTTFTGGFGKLYKEGNAIVSSNEAVIAPGTSGEFAIVTEFANTNAPEVSFKLDYTVEITNTSGVPLVFYINDDTTEYDAAGLVAELNENMDVVYLVDQEDGMLADQALTVKWAWKTVSDEADTAFGNEAAKDNAATVSIKLSSKIEQIVDAGAADTYA